MEITLHDMRRLVDIATQLEKQHAEFVQAIAIQTIVKPRGEKVYIHVSCETQAGAYHNYRYKVDVTADVPEDEGWPVNQIGYDNFAPKKEYANFASKKEN
jgi:hypothetical protein